MQPRRMRLGHVLCPTDFSEFSARALRHATAMASHFEARLTVLHAVPDRVAYETTLPYPVAWDTPRAAELMSRAADELDRFVEPVLEGVPLRREVRQGVPWRVIREAAETLPADLVVMGTHGRGGFERFILGSVAEQVLRTVSCPILTVCHEQDRPAAAPGRLSRIVCATDLSESSETTIAFALSLAAESQARLTFLHVIESLPEDGFNDDRVSFRRNLKETLRRKLHDLIPDAARAWCEVEERVETGKAHRQILELAARDGADLIVIGGCGASRLETLVFGSTAQRLVRAAPCPVLTVRRGPERVALRVVATTLAVGLEEG